MSDEKKQKSNALEVRDLKNSQRIPFLLIILLGVASLFFTRMPYIVVDVLKVTGYDLFLGLIGDGIPELMLSGLMVLIRIILGIGLVVCCLLALFDRKIRMHRLKKVILGVDFFYLLVTIIPFFHLINIISIFDNASIGIGCYFNLAVGVINILVYIFCFAGKMEEK